jgi:hypothetical protein
MPVTETQYLCSQAAEKVIRAVLTSEGKHGGIGHKLDMMVDMVPDENPVKPLLREIESLGDWQQEPCREYRRHVGIILFGFKRLVDRSGSLAWRLVDRSGLALSFLTTRR